MRRGVCGGAFPLAGGTEVAAVCAGGKCKRNTETVLEFVADHKVGEVILTAIHIKQNKCIRTKFN